MTDWEGWRDDDHVSDSQATLRVEAVKKDHAYAQQPEKEDSSIPDHRLTAAIEEALSKPRAEILVRISGHAVARHDLETLSGKNLINDVIVNAYLSLIVDRNRQNPQLPALHAFDTFFWKMYIARDYDNVRQWTQGCDIFSNDMLLIPVHLELHPIGHWCMAIVDLRVKEIKYLDSLGGRNDEGLKLVLRYLSQEMLEKKKRPLDSEEWHLVHDHNLPKQDNGFDCGIFALKYADFLAQDAEIKFSQADMPRFRHTMMYELLNSSLLPLA